MKIWLDDIRPEPTGWLPCTTAEQVIEVMEMATPQNPVTHISLDYHLGAASTGDKVLHYILNNLKEYGIAPPGSMEAHTSDGAARAEMNRIIYEILKMADKKGIQPVI